jgi:hypothetical protein
MTHIYPPLHCYTGARHMRPAVDTESNRRHYQSLVRFGMVEFSGDYATHVEVDGPIDAPDFLPSGGLRAVGPGSEVLLIVGSVRRDA